MFLSSSLDAPARRAILGEQPSQACVDVPTVPGGAVRRKAFEIRTRGDPIEPLPELILYFSMPVGALEHLARFAPVGRADDAVALHHVEDTRRAAVAQTEVALQCRGRRFAHLQHEAQGVFVRWVLLVIDALAVRTFVFTR